MLKKIFLLLYLTIAFHETLLSQCFFPPIIRNTCSGNAVIFSSAGYNFTWSNPIITPANSITGATASLGQQSNFLQALNNPTNQQATAVYTLFPFGTGCSAGQTFTITVNVSPLPTVNIIPNQTVCEGQLTQPINFTSPISGTTYTNWGNSNSAIGLSPSGAGSILPFTANNPTSGSIFGNISITPLANGCVGNATQVTTITIKPTPSVSSISPQFICEGQASQQLNLVPDILGSTITWFNANPTNGLAASGNGNVISSFIGNNPTNNLLTSVISAAATKDGCISDTVTISQITVAPTPIVNVLPDQNVCNGASTQAIIFSSPVANTTFSNWNNSNSSIGLATSGNGNINSFNAFSNAEALISGQIKITPSANGCTGTQTLVTTIFVRPSPIVNPIQNITVCANQLVTVPNFTSNLTNAVYTWENINTTIGLTNSGNTSISPFTGLNTFNSPNSSTVSVRAAEPGCSQGPQMSFTITINPLPAIPSNINGSSTVCQGQNNVSYLVNSIVNATSYTWNFSSSGASIQGTSNNVSVNFSNIATSGNLTVRGQNACGQGPVSAIFPIVVNALPIATAGANATICQGGTTTALGGLVSGSASGGTWSSSAGGTFTPNANNLNATWTPPAGFSGTTTLTLTTSGGICGTDTDTKQIIVTTSPVATAGPAIAAICQGGTTTALGASVSSPATGGTWSSSTNPQGTFTPNATTLNATWAPPAGFSGAATLTLTTSGGSCGTDTDTKQIVVTPSPVATAGPAIAAICQGGTTTALGASVSSPATGGIWSTPSGGTFTPNTTALNATWTPPAGFSGTATLTLTASGGSCGTDTDAKQIVVIPSPAANAGPAIASICQGGTTSALGGSISGSAIGGIWSSSTTPQGTFTPNATTLNATWTPPVGFSGIATLTLSTSGGSCGTDSDTKQIEIQNQGLEVSAAFTFEMQTNAYQFSITDTTGIEAVNWTFSDGSTAAGFETIHTFPQNGTFQVTAIAVNGCGFSDTTTQQISVSVSIDDFSEVNNLEIFPNPFNNSITIQAKHSSFVNMPIQLELVNLAGEVIFSKEQMLTSTQISLNLDSVIPGIYFLKISNIQSQSLKKIVKI